MPILEALTSEQDALLDVVAAEYIEQLTLPRCAPDMAVVRAWLGHVYSLYDLPVPERIEVVPSPYAAFELAGTLAGVAQTHLDWCGVSDAGWVAFYDYFARIGVLEPSELDNVMALRAFQRCCWDTMLFDECAIVVMMPWLRLDRDGNLHNAIGPAVLWPDGHADYAWHGVWVPERMITAPRSYSRDEYLAITDTEVRRALGEIAGWEHVVSLLGASVVDTWTDPHTSLRYELLKNSDGEAWLRKQSPVLKTGAQPYYIEPVHEELQTAQAARKWQATNLSPEDCESDPSLTYGVES